MRRDWSVIGALVGYWALCFVVIGVLEGWKVGVILATAFTGTAVLVGSLRK
jgi:hypothetical protein